MTTLAQTFELAVRQHQARNLPVAERLYLEVLRADPRHVDAWNYLGILYLATGAADRAVEHLTEAVQLNPDGAELHFNLGSALKAQGKFDEAIASWRRTLQLKPDFFEALNNLGNTLAAQGKLDEAIAHLTAALRLRPDAAAGHNNLGAIFKDQGKLDQALACYREALRHRPDFVEAHSNLALALLEQGNLADAAAAYDRALRLRPGDAEVHHNRAHLWLLQGDFERGWAEYAWRWRRVSTYHPPIRQPGWDGSPLKGRTILLYCEQGLGDALQFIRYAPLVKERGGRVIVECRPALEPLLSRCPGVDQVVAVWERTPGVPARRAVPDFDTWAPLMTLPYLLKTTLASIPATIPYLAADPELTRRWAAELGGLPPLRVGIAWQGNPEHPGDRWRSLPLTAFAPLADIAGVNLVSLQHGPGTEQLGNAAFPIVDLGSRFSTFADTAAAIANLDLVITVDSAIAHCAGALGVPVWVLIRSSPCFRWMLHREDSPWYPTLRLFRQTRWGDWSDVLAKVSQALACRR